MRRCPKHPAYPYDYCAVCERLIAEREYEREHGEGDVEAAERAYERHLDEIGGSR